MIEAQGDCRVNTSHKRSPEPALRLSCVQMLAEKVRLARKEVKSAQNLILQAELKARRRVLRRLGYVDSEGVVTVKGRAAAEIQSADELVLTELMFNGVFKVGYRPVSGSSRGA